MPKRLGEPLADREPRAKEPAFTRQQQGKVNTDASQTLFDHAPHGDDGESKMRETSRRLLIGLAVILATQILSACCALPGWYGGGRGGHHWEGGGAPEHRGR